MREFSNNISEALLNGLRRDERTRRQEDFLYDAKNVRIREFGLDEPDSPTDPFDGGESVSYPFPQLFHGKYYTLLCFASVIKTVNMSTDPWTASTLTLVNLDGTAGSISGSGHWHFIDLEESWFLFNGTDVVFIDPLEVFDGDNVSSAYVSNAVTIGTGTFHQGRAIVGKLDSSDIWSQGFDEVFNSLEDDIEGPLPLLNEGIDGNSVLWSSVGAYDFPTWLFFPDRAVHWNIDDMKLVSDALFRRTALFDTLTRNEFGFKKMPFQGDVLCIKPLGDHIIVYGEDGIVALTPFIGDGISTMRETQIANFGISDRAHVGGDQSHIFISSRGILYSLTADLSLNKLGYDHYFNGLSNVRISFDSNETEFHISSGSTNFLLTQRGLSKERYQITSGVARDGNFNAMFATDADDEVLIVTSTYDFGLRAIKTINSIQFGSTFNGNMTVAVDYRYKDSDSFTRTSFVPVNDESGAFIRISAVDFRFVIKCDDLTGFELDYIQVKWQASDKRQIRGVYVSPTST